jgi:hypothetical protein
MGQFSFAIFPAEFPILPHFPAEISHFPHIFPPTLFRLRVVDGWWEGKLGVPLPKTKIPIGLA